jgi:SAM-dependent methyltransferase
LRTIIYSLILCTGVLASAAAQSWAYDDGTTPFVVSPDEVVDRMLRLAEVRAGDYLIDLGSGDGRIVIEAAKRAGARGLGVDIDPRLVRLARDNAKRAGVESLAKFEVRDLFETDLREASIVTMYLLPEVNRKLVPRLLEQLKPGARIVSHDYDLGESTHDEMVEIAVPEKMVGPMGRSKVFLWVVPVDARGAWSFELPGHGGAWQFRIGQSYQLLDVEARVPGGVMAVRGARLRGDEVRLAITGTLAGKPWNQLFRGKLAGDRIAGQVRVSDGENTTDYPWNATRKP